MSGAVLLAAALTLADLETRLLERNPEYRQAEAAVRMAEGQRVQAGLYPNPTVGSTGEHVAKSTRGGSVGGFVEQQIVLGGKLGIARRMADQEVEQAKAMREAWRLRVRGSLMGNFYATLAAVERVKTRKDLLGNAEDSARIARELRNVGILDEPDVRMAEVEAQRAAVRLLEAEQREGRSWLELASLLNEDRLERQPLAGDLDELPRLDRESVWARIREQSPEVRMAITERVKAELAVREAKAALVPNLQLRGGLRNNREDGDVPKGRPVGVEGIFDIGIEIPIFNRQQGNLRTARAGVEKMRLESERTERALQRRFAEAWQHYESARLTAARYRNEMIPAARQAYQMYQRNFRTMQAEYPKLLTAQREYFALWDEYYDALESGWLAASSLESLLLAGQDAR
jgi:cobalt-zinc-cadmium efflux system outer membrane protein